jgi:hypothetical protein
VTASGWFAAADAAAAGGATLDAFVAQDSVVDAAWCTVRGGAGSNARPFGGDAMSIRGSAVRLTRTTVEAGRSVGPSPAHSLYAIDSDVVSNADPALQNRFVGPIAAAASRVRDVAFPYAAGVWWRYPEEIRASVGGLPGSTAVLLVGLPQPPVCGELGCLWLGLSPSVLLFAGTVPAWGTVARHAAGADRDPVRRGGRRAVARVVERGARAVASGLRGAAVLTRPVGSARDDRYHRASIPPRGATH